MAHRHLSSTFLQQLSDGTKPLSELLLRVYEHLLEVCPDCAAAVDAFVEEQEAQALADRLDPLPMDTLSSIGRRIDRERSELEALRPVARQAVEELLAADSEEAHRLVRGGDERLLNPVAVNALLEACRERITADPRGAHEIAHLAEQLALRLPVEGPRLDIANDLLLRSMAQRANCLRASGDLSSADRLMGQVLVDRSTSCDPLVQGEILRVAAALRKDQRRFEEAQAHLGEALGVYRDVADPHQQGKVLLARADLHSLIGEPRRAMKDLREAIAQLEPDREPYLELCLHHNLAWTYCDLDLFGEAREQMEAAEGLYERVGGPLVPLRHAWLKGRIARGLEDSDRAEEAFGRARDGFLEASLPYDAALVCLDLALLYAEQGRTAELQELAESMVATFRVHDIHREALASLALLQQAAATEVVTLGMIRDLSSYLEESRRDPSLRFGDATSH